MVRISKQSERRATSPRRPSKPSPKTGALKDKLKNGYKVHENAAPEELKKTLFFPKI